MYGIILTDEPGYDTAHLIRDKALWDWLHEPVDFGNDPAVTAITIPLPVGYKMEGEPEVEVTIGSPENDKAQIITHLGIEAAELLHVATEDGDEDDFTIVGDEDEDEDHDEVFIDAAKKVLQGRGVNDANVYVGLWY